jgi:hypothetical protein
VNGHANSQQLVASVGTAQLTIMQADSEFCFVVELETPTTSSGSHELISRLPSAKLLV